MKTDEQTCGVTAVNVTTDRALGRAGRRSLRYLRIGVHAAQAERRAERLPVQVAFALDRSGSMGGEKMVLARQAVSAALQRLQADDHFAISVFDDLVEVVAPAAQATPSGLEAARRALGLIDARGSTALYGGWDAACGELATVRRQDAVARCILVTDGQANHGPSGVGELAEAARQRRALGIATTTLGIGTDFREELLAAMSRAGGGQFYYVQRAGQLEAILAAEISEAMDVVARGVVVELWPSPGVRLEVLSDYPSTWTGTHLRVEVGDLVSNQHMDLFATALLPAGQEGEQPSVEVRASDAEGPLELPVQLATWRLVDSSTNRLQPRDFGVLRPVAELLVARVLLEVLERNRRGDFTQVQRRIDEVLKVLGWLGPDDAEIRKQIERLLDERMQLSSHVDEMSLKERHMYGTQVARSKMPDGSSQRQP